LNGKSYTPARMVKDKINNTVFIKIQAADLSSPVFGEVINLAVSSEVWLETSAGVFSPTLAVALNQDLPDAESISSERAVRRIVLHDATQEGDQGAPAWDVQGALVGLVESKTGERISIIPSSAIATSFSSLLNTGAIKHAALGVYAVDLTAWRIEGDRGTLPVSGALLKANRRLGKPAVAKQSAAERAGLKAGDVILIVERDMLDGTADLGEVLSEYRPDTEVTLRINRDGKELDVKVKLGSTVTSEEIK
jgi:serine protease Do